MGYICIKIDDESEKKLRVKIAQKGGKKGDLSKAVDDAIKMYLEKD